MRILALEFSSPQRSVAVLNGQAVAEVIEASADNAMQPLSRVERALRDAGIEREAIGCIVVGLGPGSYTGIRAAIALAQGWQLARGVALLGLSSAACVAAQAQATSPPQRVSVVIDAQRGEFYLAGYELHADGLRQLSDLRLAGQADVTGRERAGDCLIGPEVTRWFPGGRIVFPRAAMLARMASARADFVAGELLQPIYLRETGFVKSPPPRPLPD